MRYIKTELWMVMLVLFVSACSNDPGSGPKEVKWDRDICERCRMVVSDRHYSAQVRWKPAERRSQVRFFDDIGCAVLWLEDKPWRDASTTEIWAADYRSGDWIDARTATYVKDRLTPMEYGLGAQPEPAVDGLDYAAAKKYISRAEERFNIHGVHLLDRLKEQAERRKNRAVKLKGQTP